MTRNYQLQKHYRCKACGADVEAAGGPDHMSAWRCKNCDWSTIQDGIEPGVPDGVEKHDRIERKRKQFNIGDIE